jgi:cytochrome P450
MPAIYPPISMSLSSGEILLDVPIWIIVVVFALIALIALAAAYPDSLIGTAPRPEIKTAQGALPLIGNTWSILASAGKKGGCLDALLHTQQEDGPGGQPVTMTLPAMGRRIIFIHRPEYIHFVQKTEFENFVKGRDFLHCFEDLLGREGIFVADGDIWKRQRKIASHIFSVVNFKSCVQETIQKDVNTMVSLMEDASRLNAEVDLPDLFFRFALSSFCQMAFSADLECLPDNVEGLSRRNEFADAFDFAQLVADGRFASILPLFIEHFTAQGAAMRKSISTLKTYCYRIIDLRLKAVATGQGIGAVDSKQGKDLLELFIGMGLSREECLPVVLNFMIAGRDTTAQSLAWAFYRFWQHPEAVKKIRSELQEKIGDRQLTYDDVKVLPYLQAAFYEAIRLNPAVPKNTRSATKDTVIRPYSGDVGEKTLSNGGVRDLPDIPIKKGESVIWSDYCMARMPEVWGEDYEDYKPERFLEVRTDGSLQIKTYSQAIFHAFNAGPRACPGQNLATFEAMSVIAAILMNFDILYDGNELERDPPTYAESVTHPIKNPYKVRFVKRLVV